MEKYLATNLRGGFRDALLGFMAAMCEWETLGYKKSLEAFSDDSLVEALDRSMKSDLLKIFKKYVVDEGRNYDRVENIVCGRYPEYDLVNDEVEVCESNGSTVSVIIRKKTGLCASFRLTFIMDGETCKVSRRDLQNGEKWQRTYV
ncbi:NTF2 fold immunity protein [Pseudomonas putida]|uniref:NTF2 fold immunity protein n=1 Tax=Pseudomonas putida TaxID=303 RepID=UPI00067F37D9|nr:NTF2 fold immunity protein [Pseudomonas putida]